MPAGGRATVRSRRLGAELRRLRRAAELTSTQVAELLACSQPKISRMESGAVTIRLLELRLLMDRYGVTDPERRQYLESLARGSNEPGWWAPWSDTLNDSTRLIVEVEDDARAIRTWQPMLIPGLLQTADYARAVLRASLAPPPPDRLDALVELRRRRQDRFATDPAFRFHAIVWEAALLSRVGGGEVRAGQLRALLDAGERDTVTLQVLPLSAGERAGMSGAFVLLSFGDAVVSPEAVFLERPTGNAYLEHDDELSAYSRVFEILTAAALSPDASAELIAALADDAR